MTELVTVERKGNSAIVTLNRPNVMNALSAKLMQQLASVFRALKTDREISAVILTGAGKAFCAGLDLEELSAEHGLGNIKLNAAYDIQGAILDFDRPVIGAINGVAATGGFELALWCDVLIASENARFADTHARVGLLPGWGLSQHLSRMIGINRARELSFTGNFLSARQAEQWGLVNRVVSAVELISVCTHLADDMAECDQATLIQYKRLINEGAGMNLANALQHERFVMDLYAETKSGSDIAVRKASVIHRGREQG